MVFLVFGLLFVLDVGKGLEDVYGVGCLLGVYGFLGYVDMGVVFGDNV